MTANGDVRRVYMPIIADWPRTFHEHMTCSQARSSGFTVPIVVPHRPQTPADVLLTLTPTDAISSTFIEYASFPIKAMVQRIGVWRLTLDYPPDATDPVAPLEAGQLVVFDMQEASARPFILSAVGERQVEIPFLRCWHCGSRAALHSLAACTAACKGIEVAGCLARSPTQDFTETGLKPDHLLRLPQFRHTGDHDTIPHMRGHH